MEQFNLIGELQLLAAANGWRCVVGASDEANAAEKLKYQDIPLNEEELLLWIDDTFTPSRGIAGKVDAITYNASINLLAKIDFEALTESNIDETIEQKRARRVKEVAQILSDAINALVCANNLSVTSEVLTPVYNIFDENFDGIAGSYTIEQTDFETPAPVELTVDAEDNGVAIYNNESYNTPTTFEVTKYSKQSVYANPDAGFKFLDFLVNGSQKTINPISLFMASDKEVIARFIESVIKQLTIAVSGNGTTNPVPGTYPTEAGTVVSITAIETYQLFYFDRFNINGVDNFNNPITPQINDNTSAVAYFIEYLQFLKTFTVQEVVNQWYFIDETSNVNNVLIKNGIEAEFDGISSRVDFFDEPLFENQDFDDIYYININTGGKIQIIYGIQTQFNPSFDLSGYAARLDSSNRITTLIARDSNTLDQHTSTNALNVGENYKIQFKKTGTDLTINVNNALFYNKTIPSTINYTVTDSVKRTGIGTYFNNNAPIGFNFDGLINSFKINGYSWCLNQGQLTTIYNEDGINGTLSGVDLFAFWSGRGDMIPNYYVLGVTLYQNNTDSSIMPLCFNTVQAITGFTRIGYFPAGSGILKGLTNKYDNIQIVGETTDADFDSLNALPTLTSDYELTKTADAITEIKVKTI